MRSFDECQKDGVEFFKTSQKCLRARTNLSNVRRAEYVVDLLIGRLRLLEGAPWQRIVDRLHELRGGVVGVAIGRQSVQVPLGVVDTLVVEIKVVHFYDVRIQRDLRWRCCVYNKSSNLLRKLYWDTKRKFGCIESG